MRQLSEGVRGDRGVRREPAGVELGRRPRTDGLVHPVLLRQHHAHRAVGGAASATGVAALQPLKEGDAEAEAVGRLRLDDGRQLLVVSREHGAAAAQQRHPATRLERLRRLVDDDDVEGVVGGQRRERAVLRARVGAQHHLRRQQQVAHALGLPRAQLLAQLLDVGAQLRATLLVELLLLVLLGTAPRRAAAATATTATTAAAATEAALRRVELALDVAHDLAAVGGGELCVERDAHHRRQQPRRVADAHDAAQRAGAREQPLRQVVNRHVRRRRREHALAARHRLLDQLDERRRLAGAGRPVHERNRRRAQPDRHRAPLALVEAAVEERVLGQRRRRWPCRQLHLVEQHAAQLRRLDWEAAAAQHLDGALEAAVGHVVVQQVQRDRLD